MMQLHSVSLTQVLVSNLLGNLQLKIVSHLISEHAILKILLGEHVPRHPSIYTKKCSVLNFMYIPLGLELLPPTLDLNPYHPVADLGFLKGIFLKINAQNKDGHASRTLRFLEVLRLDFWLFLVNTSQSNTLNCEIINCRIKIVTKATKS